MPSINHLLTIAILLSAALLPISCNKQRDKQDEQYSTHRAEMETIAQQRLTTARKQLKEDNCQAAKSSIEAMRHDCYLALTARQQGILLMVSNYDKPNSTWRELIASCNTTVRKAHAPRSKKPVKKYNSTSENYNSISNENSTLSPHVHTHRFPFRTQ